MKITPDARAQIAAAYGENRMRVNEIAARFGVTRTSVIQIGQAAGHSRREFQRAIRVEACERVLYDRFKTCQWISGDPSADAAMCSRKAVAGKPYCVEHCRVSYQPAHSHASLPDLSRSLRKYL